MNFRFDFAGNFLSSVNISRRIHCAANCSVEFFIDIPWFRYLANLHEYWIESRREALLSREALIVRAAEVQIHFSCCSFAHYLIGSGFRQVPRCRISTTANCCNADTDVAAAGATCGDSHGEEEFHNSNADERAGRSSGGRHLLAQCWDGPDGRCEEDVRRQRARTFFLRLILRDFK